MLVALTLAACRRDPDEGAVPGAGLVINEVLSLNDAAWIDPDGPPTAEGGECPEFDDFVELYNGGSDPIDIGGFHLWASDEDFVLPSRVVQPGEHLLVIADENAGQGDLHAPWGVSADGETLRLANRDGGGLDWVDVPPTNPDLSWGRYGDGADRWRELVAPSPGSANEAPPDDPCLTAPTGFDDHSVGCIHTLAGFDSLASARSGLSVVKFDILSFQDPNRRHVRLLDNRFYDLHDEYYIFRMLNGQPFEGENLYQPYDGDFATFEEIVAWANSVPFDQMFPTDFVQLLATGRLSSAHYYTLALGDVRYIGVGTLMHGDPTEDRGEVWAFELEYSDDISYADLAVYFQTLVSALPAEVGPQLRWLVRSADQELLAQQMEDQGLAYADRVLRYDELSAPGTVEVYHEGTVAGKVRLIRAGDPIQDVTSNDILILEEIPDELPPCAALITSVPQTPLAHIALLAESRGIPNLHVEGIADDPKWGGWAPVHASVVLRATAPDQLEVVPMTSDDWTTWLDLRDQPPLELDPVDVTDLPLTVDLPARSADELDTLRSEIGGKSAGFLVLLDSGDTLGVDVPEDPLAITVKAYTDQVERMGFVDAVLANPVFDDPGDPRGRCIVLEGTIGFDARYPDAADASFRDLFLATHPDGTVVGDLARRGGVRERFVDTPIPADVLAPLTTELQARFGHYAATQGLRFRSSSNVEDAEGFVGAGLYESWTGYLDPEGAGTDETVERAIQQVWGSYWGVEAFEERQAVGIQHQNGAMGVLVHANFADEHEITNGVVTLTVLPPGGPLRYEMRVNAQVGAISVTNPPVDACEIILPEVDLVTAGDDGVPHIERVQPSTEQEDAVLSDADLELLFTRATGVALRWLGVENAVLPLAQARRTLTLDMEYREVDGGWPELASGAVGEERLVLKQARSLEPAPIGLPEEVTAAPFPRDLLARARRVTETSCASAGHTVSAIEALTDPALAPDMGWSEVPFTAEIVVDGVALDHLAVAVDHPSVDPWALHAIAADPVAAGFTEILVDEDSVTIDGVAEPLAGACTATTLWASPSTFLDDLLR